MAFGNNVLGTAKRASFQTAGGAVMKFRHPYLAGQLAGSASGASVDGSYDEVDISSSCKLEDEYFRAEPSMDSAKQTVLVDGSVVTITNDILAGVATLQLVPTTGLVGSGDAIACFQLVKACKDSVGGVLTVSREINGKRITVFFYGAAVQNVPDMVLRGDDVPVYPCKLLYAGWIMTVGSSASSVKRIWAAGNTSGIAAAFKQLGINKADSSSTSAATAGTQLGDADLNDSSVTDGITNNDAANLAGITSDVDILGVVYDSGNSVVEQTSLS